MSDCEERARGLIAPPRAMGFREFSRYCFARVFGSRSDLGTVIFIAVRFVCKVHR